MFFSSGWLEQETYYWSNIITWGILCIGCFGIIPLWCEPRWECFGVNRPLLWWLIFKSDNYVPSTLYKALCDYYYILKGNIPFSFIKKNLNLKPLSIRSFFLLYWIWYIWSIFLRNHQDIFDKLGHISHYLTRIVTFTHSAQCYYRLITKIKLLNIFIIS